jgi:hypothetical protein
VGVNRSQPVIRDGWGPVQVSSYTPWWDYWRDGWGSQQRHTYNPAHYLRQPSGPTSVSEWQRKRLPIQHLRDPQGSNYVIPMATYTSQPNPYFDHVRVAMYSREEKGRLGQDINWITLGTKGG